MQQINWTTLTPAIVSLLIFISTALGKPLSMNDALQIATLIVSGIGILAGILTNHKKPATPVQSTNTQPPAQP